MQDIVTVMDHHSYAAYMIRMGMGHKNRNTFWSAVNKFFKADLPYPVKG